LHLIGSGTWNRLSLSPFPPPPSGKGEEGNDGEKGAERRGEERRGEERRGEERRKGNALLVARLREVSPGA